MDMEAGWWRIGVSNLYQMMNTGEWEIKGGSSWHLFFTKNMVMKSWLYCVALEKLAILNFFIYEQITDICVYG